MENKAAILKRGEFIYRTKSLYTGPNNRRYADASAPRPARYILSEQRFVTNHDDSAGFVEIIDVDDRVVKSWQFDYPMVKQFSDPDYYDDDCLILYLRETYGLPVIGCPAPK